MVCFVLLGLFVFCSLFSFLVFWFSGVYSVECGVFVFDVVGFYFSMLSMFLGFSLFFVVLELGVVSKLMLSLSVLMSVLCYNCVNALWFWVFYEMSMLPLLLLLVLESPYSERFIATWYLLGYVVFTSLPMLMSIFYISGVLGSLDLQAWSGVGGWDLCFIVLILLSVMFMTKIPLPPFHVWLPIVHAEASSPVSMFLSGYIMKLGLLGVFRFAYYLLSDYVFSGWYVLVCLSLSVMFFFCASRELDGKRWLAFLSLSHIVMASVCLCVCSYDSMSLSFLYGLGHGLSAGVMFMFLWLVYNMCGSRNWSLLKSVFSSSLFFRCLGVACLCTAASIPPTVQFFSELLILSEAGFLSVLFVFLFSLYLFLGGLVPLFLVGYVLSRHYSMSLGSGYVRGFLGGVFFLVVWSFLLFLVF